MFWRGYHIKSKKIIGKCTLYHGDCLEIMPRLQGVGAVISDPPYGMNWPCENARFTGGIKKRGPHPKVYKTKIIGDEQPFDPIPWLEFEKVVLFGCNHFAQRLPVGTTLVWLKRYDTGFGSFLSDAEVAWMKGGHGVYCHRDLSMNRDAKRRVHPTQKPVGLMVWCMERARIPLDGIVLDPYMGSGTTGIACVKTGRHFIGIEKDKEYFDIARERIRKETAQLRLF